MRMDLIRIHIISCAVMDPGSGKIHNCDGDGIIFASHTILHIVITQPDAVVTVAARWFSENCHSFSFSTGFP